MHLSLQTIGTIFLTFLITTVFFLFNAPDLFAQSCSYVDQCVNNKRCVMSANGTLVNLGADCGSSTIGGVSAPGGVNILNRQAGNGNIGFLIFVSRIIRIVTIAAGTVIMLNFVRAGWMYILAGSETKATGEVKDLLTYSIAGIAIIALSYTIIGLIGLIFFGNAAYIIAPELVSIYDI